MITCIIGLNGSGKTWFLTKLLYEQWKKYNANIIACYPVRFSDDNDRVQRFWQLHDLYGLENGVIGFDEIQKLLNAQNWASLPPLFADLICQHRHAHLDIYGTTQDLGQIDIAMRRNINELYVCETMIRFPKTQRIKPFLHWIRVQKKIRRFDTATDRICWHPIGRRRWYFISRFWTRSFYNTYAKTALTKYLTWTIRKEGKWKTTIANRQLITSGKVRRR